MGDRADEVGDADVNRLLVLVIVGAFGLGLSVGVIVLGLGPALLRSDEPQVATFQTSQTGQATVRLRADQPSEATVGGQRVRLRAPGDAGDLAVALQAGAVPDWFAALYQAAGAPVAVQSMSTVDVCLPFDVPAAQADRVRVLRIGEGRATDVTTARSVGEALACGTVETGTLVPVVYRPIVPPRRDIPELRGTPGAVDNRAAIWTYQLSDADRAVIEAAGAGWARVTARWDELQPSANTFLPTAAATLDPLIRRASGDGARRVKVTIQGVPAWVDATGCRITTPEGRRALASFMTALVQRHRAQVQYWEFFPEPDSTNTTQAPLSCFGTLGPDGRPTQAGREAYAFAVAEAGHAVKLVDPQARVVLGNVASASYTSFASPGGCPVTDCKFDFDFLPGVLTVLKQRGLLDNIDFVSGGLYSGSDRRPVSEGGPIQPDDVERSRWFQYGGRDIVGRVTAIRQQQLEAGLTVAEMKPIMLLEVGYTGCWSEPFATPGRAGYCTPEEFERRQAGHVVKTLARSAFLDVVVAQWFLLQECGPSDVPGCDFPYGLLTSSGQRRLGVGAMRVFTQVVPGFPAALAIGAAQLGHPGVEGYAFGQATCAAGQQLWVVWREFGDAAAVTVPGQLRRTREMTGDWRDATGSAIPVGEQPVYACFVPS